MNRRRVIRIILVLFAALIVFMAAGLATLGLYLRKRSGPEFDGDLAALLPPETMLYFSFNQPARFLDTFERSRLWLEWERSGALRAALDRKDRLAKLQRNVEKFERFSPYTVKDHIVKRWLGEHFVLALIPPPRPELPPGLVILAKTETGFEEDLAEFVAENFPDIRRQRAASPHGGTITVYHGGKPHRSFAFTRFGRTVAISLRSPEPAYLEEIIRRRHDPAAPSLAQVKPFAAWQTAEGRAHPLTLYCHPAESARLFLDHPGLRPKRAAQVESLEWFLEKSEKGALLTGWMNYERELRAHFDLTAPEPLFNLARLEAAAPRFASLDFATTQTLALAVVKGDDVARLTAWLRRLAHLSKSSEKSWEQAGEALEDALGRRFWRETEPLLAREAALLIRDVTPAYLIPQMDAVAYFGVGDAAAARRAMERTARRAVAAGDGATTAALYNMERLDMPVFLTRGAAAAVTEAPPAIVLAADVKPAEALRPAWASPSSVSPLPLAIEDEPRALALAYVNTRQLEKTLDTAFAGISLLSGDAREDAERLLIYATLLAPFDSLTLTFHATDSGLAAELHSR